MTKAANVSKHFIVTLFAAIAIAFILPQLSVHASDNTTEVQITGTFRQGEARSMLNMINSFRTGGDAWYWNEDNQTKTTCSNLSKMTYDYNLEQIAMQRAAEIAISFDHTRPNGESCFSCTSNGTSSYGENIAYHYLSSAEAAYMLWREDDEKYDGQGHRRSMLSNRFTAVGIGCFEYNGYYYWVQEFGDASSEASATAANNKKTTVRVEVLNDYVKIGSNTRIALSTNSYTYNGTARKPSVTVSNGKLILNEGVHYTVSYKNNTNAGTATVTVTGTGAGGGTKSVNFTINKINNAVNAKNIVKTTSSKAQSFSLGASAKDNARLTYKSNNKAVAVKNGKVTISKNFVGKCTITITADATTNYKKTAKKITITVNPKGTALNKVQSKKGKKMLVSWKRNSNVTGYQIQYSTNKNFKSGNKTVLVKKNKTTSQTISKLKAKKKYYVRIRTYRNVNGSKIYSGWSKAKTTVTKAN